MLKAVIPSTSWGSMESNRRVLWWHYIPSGLWQSGH